MSGRDLYLVGLSHKSAPIEVRERVALTGDALREALGQLRTADGVREALVVSTCNRVEVYVQAADDAAARRFCTSRSWRRYMPAAAKAMPNSATPSPAARMCVVSAG